MVVLQTGKVSGQVLSLWVTGVRESGELVIAELVIELMQMRAVNEVLEVESIQASKKFTMCCVWMCIP